MGLNKYRAWDKTDKVMRKVKQILNFEGDGHVIVESKDSFYGLDFGGNFDRFDLMQSTGVRDCEGDLIYAGDIVKYNVDMYKVVDENGFLLVRLDNEVIDYEDFPQSIYTRCSEKTEFQGVLNDYCVSLYELICNEQDFEGCLSCEIVGNVYDDEIKQQKIERLKHGSVWLKKETGYKFVLHENDIEATKELVDEYDYVCENPHDDDDYSYLCFSQYCRCRC